MVVHATLVHWILSPHRLLCLVDPAYENHETLPIAFTATLQSAPLLYVSRRHNIRTSHPSLTAGAGGSGVIQENMFSAARVLLQSPSVVSKMASPLDRSARHLCRHDRRHCRLTGVHQELLPIQTQAGLCSTDVPCDCGCCSVVLVGVS